MTAISLTYRAIHSKVKSIDLPLVNWKMVCCVGILLCFSLLFFYIFSINQLTSGAYLIKNYNQEIAGLLSDNRSIEADFAGVNLLDKVHSNAERLGFEKTSEVKYLEILDSSLASAK